MQTDKSSNPPRCSISAEIPPKISNLPGPGLKSRSPPDRDLGLIFTQGTACTALHLYKLIFTWEYLMKLFPRSWLKLFNYLLENDMLCRNCGLAVSISSQVPIIQNVPYRTKLVS